MYKAQANQGRKPVLPKESEAEKVMFIIIIVVIVYIIIVVFN